MPFKKLIEVGRVAYCVGGPAKGKLVAIVDIIDYNRALIDGPCTGVPRQEYKFINLQLTGKKVAIQHGQRSKLVSKAWQKAKIDDKWQKSTWHKNVVKRQTRESLNDFDRFKVARLKRQRNKLVKLTQKTIVMNRRKARQALKPKQKRMKAAKKDAEDPVKRKLKIKVAKIYKTLRTKGVLSRNKKPTEKKAPAVKGKKKVGKKATKKPLKKQTKKTVAATKKPTTKSTSAPKPKTTK